MKRIPALLGPLLLALATPAGAFDPGDGNTIYFDDMSVKRADTAP